MYRIALTDDQRHELRQRTRQVGLAPSTRDRLEMVRLSDAGWSVPRIARHLGQHEQTVRLWIKAFLHGGFAALPNKPRGGKQSALTPAILDALAAHGARATFFLLGGRVASNEAIVRRIVAEGHELGNHLMTDAPSIRLPAEAFERQLLRTHELLAPFGPVRWFRPGSGWFNRRMLAQLRRHGYRCALGSAYAYDTHVRSAWYVSRHILRHARPGSVIILHDGGESRRQTVAVLGRVLPELGRRGYRVVTLSELAVRTRAPNAAADPTLDTGSTAAR